MGRRRGGRSGVAADDVQGGVGDRTDPGILPSGEPRRRGAGAWQVPDGYRPHPGPMPSVDIIRSRLAAACACRCRWLGAAAGHAGGAADRRRVGTRRRPLTHGHRRGHRRRFDACGLPRCLLTIDGVRDQLARHEIDPDRVLPATHRSDPRAGPGGNTSSWMSPGCRSCGATGVDGTRLLLDAG